MDKEKISDIYADWYELWMKQSKEFFASAEKNLHQLFAKGVIVNPEDHLKLINQWLETLKSQWQLNQLTNEQKAFAAYWQAMAKMFNDASDLMLTEWIKRTRGNDPVKNIRDLYELWLTCCQEIYQKSLRSKSYQEAYSEFMNTAFKFWKNYRP